MPSEDNIRERREDVGVSNSPVHVMRNCGSLTTQRFPTDSDKKAKPAPNLPDLPQHGLERRQRDFRCLWLLSWSDRFGRVAGESRPGRERPDHDAK
ncbi:hypothetical protein D3C72_2159800 [compost metagenome]